MAAVMTRPLEHDPHLHEGRPPARPRLALVPPAPPTGRAVVRHPVPAATYRRRRLVVALVLVALVAVALRAGAALGGSPLAASERPPSATRYVVQPGDTLWSIASHLAPNGDLRPVVDRLAQQHGSADLRPGETIVLR